MAQPWPWFRNRADEADSAYVIEPGHEARVVGDEPVDGYEFDARTAEEYARGA